MPPELAEAMKGIKHVNPNAADAYTQPAGGN
jgi:cytochrome c-type biogenesis protein CcmE